MNLMDLATFIILGNHFNSMIKNIIANFVGRFWSILSNFLFIPLYIHYLGFESFSIISFTLVIAGIMAILDAGLTATLSREFARIDNLLNDKIRIFKTLESTYFIIISICILTVFAFSGIIAENWMNLNTYNPNRVSLFLKIISFDIGFQLLLRFYMGGLLGLEKQVKANVIQVGWGIMRNGFVVVLVMFIPTLEMFFFWQTISTILFTVILKLSLEKILIGKYSFDINPKIERVVFKRIWQFAGGMLLISVVAALNTQMDKLAISKLLSLENLGYYTLAISLSQGIIVLVNPIATALLPRFTSLYSAEKREEASSLFSKVSLFVSILVFTLMTNMSFYAKDLIWIWTGKMDLALHTFTLIPIVVFAYSMLSLQVIPYNIAIANGYTRLNNILGLVSLVATIPGYLISTKIYGSIGAATVFCIVQTITTFLYLYFINKKFIKVKIVIHIYLKQIIIPIILSIGFTSLLYFIPHPFKDNRILLLSWIALSTFITLSALIIILIPNKDLSKLFKFKLRTQLHI